MTTSSFTSKLCSQGCALYHQATAAIIRPQHIALDAQIQWCGHNHRFRNQVLTHVPRDPSETSFCTFRLSLRAFERARLGPDHHGHPVRHRSLAASFR